MDIIQTISSETDISTEKVSSVVDLLNDGNTIPFIARYRKEKIGNLDEVQIRLIRDRFEYVTELDNRKSVVLSSIDEQGHLTAELRQKILTATTKQSVEDLYLPFKPKKRTRGTIAKEMGLESMAELIKNQLPYDDWVTQFLAENPGLEEEEVTRRARDIVAEWISEDADIKEHVRKICWAEGVISTTVQKEFEERKTKFEMYYDFSEAIRDIPAHRFLAIRRGEEESVIKIKFELPIPKIEAIIAEKWISHQERPSDDLELSIKDSLQRLLLPSIEVDVKLKLKTNADDDSITVFNNNLKKLLLAPLAGAKMVLGMDPGFKSGTKWVVVDQTGKFLEKGTIYPVPPRNETAKSQTILSDILQRYACEYICIGNGTASREIMSFVRNFLSTSKNSTVKPIIVNESGASVYSASDIAREEFPDMDVSFRGAVSIARRFQDPLAELVKIDPKSIGVGQYQHDVNQKKLKKSLDETVESCVNYVGVNLNTASASLLSFVSGMNKTLAKNVVRYRDENGAFKKREELTNVDRFGPKSFEQAAGFLRILDGLNPLDQSAVHPENYLVVHKMATDQDVPVGKMVGNVELLNKIPLSHYVTESIGLLTLRDIVDELKKPGRDPRTSFTGAKLDENIQSIENLLVGMKLEGTVTNMTKFGAFVDIGVHHDGLIHLSEMSDRFIKDPSDVCGVGDILTVRVLSVDLQRKRIGLTLKSESRQMRKNQRAKKGGEKEHSALTGKISADLEILANKFKGHR